LRHSPLEGRLKMKTISFYFRLFLLLTLTHVGLASSRAQEAVLEHYVLGVGQNSDGVATALGDKYFGGGTARAAVSFIDTARRQNPDDASGNLVLFVTRQVRPGEITFALLCFGVQVRGFDSEGTQVFSRDLPGFTFGDSKSGRYTKVVRAIPIRTSKLEVTFLGNYE
jgi:hypothetical protein